MTGEQALAMVADMRKLLADEEAVTLRERILAVRVILEERRHTLRDVYRAVAGRGIGPGDDELAVIEAVEAVLKGE